MFLPLLWTARDMRRRSPHSVDDVLVAGATTNVSSDALPNFPICRLRIVAQEFQGAEKHPWSEKTTLQSMVLPEGLMQRMKFAPFGEPFDRRHFRPIGLNSEDETRADGLPVEHHCTSATDPMFAAHVSAGKAQSVAEKIG